MATRTDNRPPYLQTAINNRNEALTLISMGMPLPPWGDALILIGDEQQRRWEQGEAPMTKQESDLIHAYYMDMPLPPWSEAMMKIIFTNVRRWKEGHPPLSKNAQQEILSSML